MGVPSSLLPRRVPQFPAAAAQPIGREPREACPFCSETETLLVLTSSGPERKI